MHFKTKQQQYQDYLDNGGQLGLLTWEQSGHFDWALAGLPNPNMEIEKTVVVSFGERGMITKKIEKGTVYICGPITDMPQNNYPAFETAEVELKKRGIPCVNPHALFDQMNHNGFTHDEYMRTCISFLAQCDKVVTLRGWEGSKGALIETRVARLLDKEIAIIESILSSNYKVA